MGPTQARVVINSNDYLNSMNQVRAVCESFAKMETIPLNDSRYEFYHEMSLRLISQFEKNLQRLAELDVPGGTLDWAVGVSHSTSRKSIRWNLEWKDDGSILSMGHRSAALTKPRMVKKNLLDGHNSDQKWVSETCWYHSNVPLQARLEEWLDYAETQRLHLEGRSYDQQVSRLTQGVTYEQNRLDEVHKNIGNLQAYLQQLDDPDYIKTYVESQIAMTEAKIETLESQVALHEKAVNDRQEVLDNFVDSASA